MDHKQVPSEAYYPPPPLGYYPPSPPIEKEIHLLDYLKVLQKRKWLILAIFAIVFTVTAVGIFTVKPVFRGTSTIQIDKENPQIVDFREIFTVSAWDTDYYQTHYQILASRQLAKRVIYSLNIYEHPEFLPGPETPLQKLKSGVLTPLSRLKSTILNFTYTRVTPSQKTSSEMGSGEIQKDAEPKLNSPETAKETAVINQFLARLTIEPVKNTRLVKIHFDSYFPELSSQVANSIATNYIKLNLENRFNATEQAKEQLNQQLDLMRAKVESADEALQEFCEKHGFVFLDDKEKNVAFQRLADLNEALAKTESERMAKEALYRQTKKGDLDSIPSVMDNKLIQELKQTYLQLEVEYSKLSETFKPEYPEMVRMRKQMEAIQRRLDAEYGRCVSAIKMEYEYSLRKESLVRSAFEQQKSVVTEMQQKSIQYNILKREADINRDLYKNLLQRMKEAGIQAGITASNIQVVDQAAIPARPYKPNIPHTVLWATLIGLFLGVGIAFFFEYLDNTIKSSEEVEKLIGLPSFGMVPEISTEKIKQLERGRIYPVELITFGHPRSLLSEVYRNIRTAILLSFSERPPKTMVISSPNPMEGKTTTAVNMAIAFSQLGSPVLVIDGDMRKPRVHKVFSGSNGVGLSSFLSGNAELKSIIKPSSIPNLFYIPSGPIPPNPSELLGSNLFKNMLQFLGRSFEQIIFDAPPVLSFGDSLILSNCVDGVVLVVLSGKTPKETLQQSKNALFQVNAKILGVIVNRVDLGHLGQKYYNYYGNYSYYQEETKTKELPDGRSHRHRSG
ncbi:MAG: GumC family protein [Thermodesulfobacteriota bacterium]